MRAQITLADLSTQSLFAQATHNPAKYPMNSHNERQAWAMQRAINTLVAHDPRFAAQTGGQSFVRDSYSRINMDELERHGSERILTDQMKQIYELDMDEIAVRCGVREGDNPEQMTNPWNALMALREDAKKEYRTSINKAPINQFLAELRADLLGSIGDVLAAADDTSHPQHQDAKMAILLVEFMLGSSYANLQTSLGLSKEGMSDDKFDEQCGAITQGLKTPFSRSLLLQMAQHILEINPLDPTFVERNTKLQAAIGIEAQA